MNGDEKPLAEPNGRSRDGSEAFLPIGIVFVVVAIGMMFSGTTSWIAFFTIGTTFLIRGTQKTSNKDEIRPPRPRRTDADRRFSSCSRRPAVTTYLQEDFA